MIFLYWKPNQFKIEYNDWVYEKVCLDKTFNYTTITDSKLSYTPCYV